MVDQKRKGHRRTSSSSSYGCNSCSRHNQEKDFQCWTSLWAVFGMMVPSCCAGSTSHGRRDPTQPIIINMGTSPPTVQLSSSVVTGTIFGQRRGRVNFCVQEDPASPPLLLLEFAIPTHLLIKEMQSGLLRITLECDKKNSIANNPLCITDPHGGTIHPLPLFAEPVWSMCCNGRKVGFAMKKTVKSADSDPALSSLMSLMQGVTSGAGVIPCRTNSNKHNGTAGTLVRDRDGSPDTTRKDAGRTLPNGNGALLHNRDGVLSMAKGGTDSPTEFGNGNKVDNGSVSVLEQDDPSSRRGIEKPSLEDDELIYMRANYERVVGSPDSEAFHMINPDGSQCQELSIFLTRS